MRVDFFALKEKDGVKYGEGHSLPFGATYYGDGIVNFSINSVNATSCTLVLYHKGDEKPYVEIDIPEDYKIGDNYSIMVFGLDIEDVEYGYRFDGPYNPKKGLYFDRRKILLDPYVQLVSGSEVWGQRTYDDEFPLRGNVLRTDYEWEGDTPIGRPMEDTVIYELHVRGYTKHDSSGAKRPGTYSGLVEKIPYFKKLGINCIELLPIFEFNELEFDKLPHMPDFNFWGYSPVVFFAPKAGYAYLGPKGLAAEEFKNLVKQMHREGIEVVLDVVFNHTAELNDKNVPIHDYNYRCIDNPTYYIMNSDGTYANYSGCSNTFNCNHPIVRNMILDCLRYWVAEYHIDGFRFDLASILSRDTEGNPMANPPLLESLAMDPLLSKTKLIAEAWDAGGLYQVGSFPAPKRWAEWNGRFRDCVRGFICGDGNAGRELVSRMQGSPDIFSSKTTGSVVNFVTCHDGFTLMDLVSYNEKHNLANNENNRDGSNDNISWNCGVEGPTDDPSINALRRRNIKNALTILLMSRGTPMLLAGDEFGNTQFGNNNAYCQDGDISWLNWDLLKENEDIFEFVQKMIALRKAHPILRRTDFYNSNNSTGYPEISFHGTRAWDIDLNGPSLTLAIMYAESAKDFKVPEDHFIYVGMNSYSEYQRMELPVVPKEFVWKKYVDTADVKHDDSTELFNEYWLAPHSTVVMVAKKKASESAV